MVVTEAGTVATGVAAVDATADPEEGGAMGTAEDPGPEAGTGDPGEEGLHHTGPDLVAVLAQDHP